MASISVVVTREIKLTLNDTEVAYLLGILQKPLTPNETQQDSDIRQSIWEELNLTKMMR